MATVTFIPIASTTTATAASTVTVSSIPQTYTDLFIVVKTRSTWSSDNGTRLQMTVNGDSSTVYSYTSAETNGGTAYAERGYSGTYIWAGRNNNEYGGNTEKSLTEINIHSYSSTSKHKPITTKWSAPMNGRVVGMLTGQYHSTTAITSVSFFSDGNMAAGTEIIVYGIL